MNNENEINELAGSVVSKGSELQCNNCRNWFSTYETDKYKAAEEAFSQGWTFLKGEHQIEFLKDNVKIHDNILCPNCKEKVIN